MQNLVHFSSDDELADKLMQVQVDRVTLNEAARRLKELSTEKFHMMADVIGAIDEDVILSDEQKGHLQQLALTVYRARDRQPIPRDELSSLASKVISGRYTPTSTEVRSLAACVMRMDTVHGTNKRD
jgi:hypothetical protein